MKHAAVACALAIGCAPGYVVWRDGGARIVDSGGRQRVAVGRRRFLAHDAVGAGAVVVAGSHVAYAARDGRAWRVFVDDVPSGGAWDSVGTIVVRPSGRAAYAAERAHRWHVVDGASDASYDAVVALSLDDAGRVVYAARRDGAARVYVDGVPGRAWADVRELRFAPLSYVASDAGGERWVDGADGADASPRFDAIVETTANGFVAREGRRRVAFAFGRRVAEGQVHRLVTASGHYAYVRLDDRGEVVVHDGRADPTHWAAVDDVTMSRDGEGWGYAARAGRDEAVVVDGRELGRFAWARAPVFATGADTWAYVASMGAGAFVRSTRAYGAFDVAFEDSLVVRDDGRWGIVAGFDSARRFYVVVDGRPRRHFDLDAWIAGRGPASPGGGARMRRMVSRVLAGG